MKWFVNIDGKTSGPLDEEDVRAMARSDRLRGAQVRDDAGATWAPAERSPFRSLMRERGWSGPVVAALMAGLVVKLLTYVIVVGSGAPDAGAGSTVLAILGAGTTFAVLALLRRL
jgi:hypothetical protein